MSISEFFNKKSRAAVAVTALAFGGAGGFAGYQATEHYTQPHLSAFTASNAPQDMSLGQFMAGKVPAGMSTTKTGDQDEIAARQSYTKQIDVMAAEKQEYRQLTATISQDLVFPSLPMGAMEARASALHGALVDHAVSFVTDLRADENLSGRDYQALLGDYNARVGLDVTALAGNYKTGIAFTQTCQIVGDIGHSFGSRDDQNPDQRSGDIGACMQEIQGASEKLALEGGAAGAVVGGLFLLPLWRRRRNAGPQVFKSKPAAN